MKSNPAGSMPGPDLEGRLRGRIVGVSILTITVAILPGFLPGALAVQLASALGIEESGVGLVVGAFFGMSALVSTWMGRLAQRLGWVGSVRVAALGAASTLFVTPIVARSILPLAVVTVAGGTALAMAHPAVNLALARCTPPRRQGLAYGFKHAAIPAATAVAGLGLPFIAIPLGWRWVYALGGVMALVAAAMVPRSGPRYETGGVSGSSGRAEARPDSPLPLLVVVAVGAGLGIFGMDALATFLVPYGTDIGFGEAASGILLALGSAMGILVRVLAGWLVDRRATGGLVTVTAFLAVGAGGIGLMATGSEAALVVGSLLAFTFGWGWSGLFTYAVVIRNPAAPGAATGITMTGVYVGAAAGPMLFGFIAEDSFIAAWVIMAAALGVGALLMGSALVLERSLSRERR